MTYIEADPYPWPWDGDLAPTRLAVVVAGAQVHWMERTADPDTHLVVVKEITSTLRDRGAAIVWIRHGQPPNGRNSIPVHGSREWELSATPDPSDHIVDAVGHDGCYGSRLEPLLRTDGRDRVLMCGLGLEGPVHSTLRTLNDQGYECLTVTDASAPYERASGVNALSSITFSFGIFGAIAPSASVLAAFDPAVTDPTAIDTAMEELS